MQDISGAGHTRREGKVVGDYIKLGCRMLTQQQAIDYDSIKRSMFTNYSYQYSR